MAALRGYGRLPFANENIPGAYVEAVIARVRDARVLATYDFVDVIDEKKKIGWQVKSTLSTTPVTWKRAKIPDALLLITASRAEGAGDDEAQALGNAIIKFCNEHAIESMNKYELDAIGYARVYVKFNEIVYFERELITKTQQQLFNPDDFSWRWSIEKKKGKKEQLSALHGKHKPTDTKWFAWHGLGENQLHFSGEKAWWPGLTAPERVTGPSSLYDKKISFDIFVQWISEQEAEFEILIESTEPVAKNL